MTKVNAKAWFFVELEEEGENVTVKSAKLLFDRNEAEKEAVRLGLNFEFWIDTSSDWTKRMESVLGVTDMSDPRAVCDEMAMRFLDLRAGRKDISLTGCMPSMLGGGGCGSGGGSGSGCGCGSGGGGCGCGSGGGCGSGCGSGSGGCGCGPS